MGMIEKCDRPTAKAIAAAGRVRAALELQALEATIASLVTACAKTCGGGAAPDCVILQS
jgi:hypothetical protein